MSRNEGIDWGNEQDWFSGRHDAIKFMVREGCWLTLEATIDDACLMALFTHCPWSLHEAAEHGLRSISLRDNPGAAMVLGTHGDALVVTQRLGRGQVTRDVLDMTARNLICFADQCIGQV